MIFKIVSVELEGRGGQTISTSRLADIISRSQKKDTPLPPRFQDHGDVSTSKELEIIAEGVTVRAGQQIDHVWIEISTSGRMALSRKLLADCLSDQIAIDLRTATQSGSQGQEVSHRVVAFAYQPKA